MNKKYESQFLPANTYVHHSSYLGNPHISKAFKDEAEEVKQKGKLDSDGISLKYKWEYLGKAIGSGVVPFDNLVFRRITDEEIKTFDNVRQGIDWGYGVDPFTFVRWHYDRTRRRIYALDEGYGVKLSNREAAEKIKAKGYHTTTTLADSAEPKSINEIRQDHGLQIRGARKGPGSVEYGEKWLDDLEEIVIDPERTPNIAKEFEDIDYQVDQDGNPKAKLEDTNNHTISHMALNAKKLLRKRKMKVLVDTGYYNGSEIKKCVDKKLTILIKKAKANNQTKDNQYRKEKFVYDAAKDIYTCPASQELRFFENTSKNGLKYRKYKCCSLNNCPKKSQCTTSTSGRTLQRWEHEYVLEEVQNNTLANNEIYKLRRCIVEHPFGTVKRTFGYSYFLRRELENVNAESASMFIAYNLKRLLSMYFVQELEEKFKNLVV